jgi:hypothetical protein
MGYRWKLLLLYFRRETPRTLSISSFVSGLIEWIVDQAIQDGEISAITQADKDMDTRFNIEEQYQELLRREEDGM